MIKKIIKFMWNTCLIILAIGILYFVNVGSPDTNRAGQQISE